MMLYHRCRTTKNYANPFVDVAVNLTVTRLPIEQRVIQPGGRGKVGWVLFLQLDDRAGDAVAMPLNGLAVSGEIGEAAGNFRRHF